MNIVKDLIQLGYHLLRKNTLCKLGKHKIIVKKERLALGEIISVPACGIFGCGFMDTKAAVLTKPDRDGVLFAMNHTTGELANPINVKLKDLEDFKRIQK